MIYEHLKSFEPKEKFRVQPEDTKPPSSRNKPPHLLPRWFLGWDSWSSYFHHFKVTQLQPTKEAESATVNNHHQMLQRMKLGHSRTTQSHSAE